MAVVAMRESETGRHPPANTPRAKEQAQAAEPDVIFRRKLEQFLQVSPFYGGA